jgi:hypothetical protein
MLARASPALAVPAVTPMPSAKRKPAIVKRATIVAQRLADEVERERWGIIFQDCLIPENG